MDADDEDESKWLCCNHEHDHRFSSDVGKDFPRVFQQRRFAFFEWSVPLPTAAWLQPEHKKKGTRTVCVLLCMCLNLGVDPPDQIRTAKCARMECWIDPSHSPRSRAIEKIAQSMENQYKRWTPRIRFHRCMDPHKENIYQRIVALRKWAKKDRVLFHYNGHGVPKTTAKGGMWCFDKTFSNYISVSIVDIADWLEEPAVFVLDCAGAEHVINAWIQHTNSHDAQQNFSCLFLGACQGDEYLPQSYEYPRDIFTSCLTTPVKMALHWMVLQEQVTTEVEDIDMLNILLQDEEISGSVTGRNTPLHELNRVFTCITDAIAWDILPPDLFFTIFREDQLIATLFRNFILAERIMTTLGRTPVSYPAMPPSWNHPLWGVWDCAVEETLCKLRRRFEKSYKKSLRKAAEEEKSKSIEQKKKDNAEYVDHRSIDRRRQRSLRTSRISRLSELSTLQKDLHDAETDLRRGLLLKEDIANRKTLVQRLAQEIEETRFLQDQQKEIIPWTPNTFFKQQLKSFDVWLEEEVEGSSGPIQLPVVLQLLLSQSHRLPALKLFSKFFDMGGFAVRSALQLDILPYMTKLLKNSAKLSNEENQRKGTYLVKIWAKMIAFDNSLKAELRQKAHCEYFMTYLKNAVTTTSGLVVSIESTSVVLVLFLIAVIGDDHPTSQRTFYEKGAFIIIPELLRHEDAEVRTFSLLAMSKLWEHCEEAKMMCVEREIADTVMNCFRDPSTEVRAAAIECVFTLFGSVEYGPNSEKYAIDVHLAKQVARLGVDASSIVRRQAVACMGRLFWWQKAPFQSIMKSLQKYQHSKSRQRKNASQLRRIQSLPIVSDPQARAIRMPSSTDIRPMSARYSPIFAGFEQSFANASVDDSPGLPSSLSSNNLSPLPSPSNSMSYIDSPHASSASTIGTNSPFISPLLSPQLHPIPNPSPLLNALDMEHSPPSLDLGGLGSEESRLFICRVLLRMVHDPHEKVAQSATQLRRQIISCIPDDPYSDTNGGLHIFEPDIGSPKPSSTKPDLNSKRSPYKKAFEAQIPKRKKSNPHEDPFLSGINCTFFDWSISRFKLPMEEEDEIDIVVPSLDFQKDDFRPEKGITLYAQQRNDYSGIYENVTATRKIQIEEYEKTAKTAREWASKQLRVPGLQEKQIFNLKPRTCSKVCFHPYNVGRVYSASRGEKSKTTWLQVWDAAQMDKPLNSWQNGSRKSRHSSRSQDASSLAVLNEYHDPVLAVGSSDGSVRLWKDMHHSGEQMCVSAFRALSYPARRGSNNFGLRLLWNQKSQILAAAGCCSEVVRFWDINKEQCANDVQIGQNNATSICHVPNDPNLTIVGFESGDVCIIDSRDSGITTHINNLHPNSRVVKVAPHQHVLTTASLNGRICFSDPRIIRDKGPASQSFQIPFDRMDVFDAHPYAPLMAAKNCDRDGTFVSVYSTSYYDVKEICSIRYHRGFLGQRIGPVQSLQFNPHGCVLAIGSGEVISLHSGNLEPDTGPSGAKSAKKIAKRHRKQRSDPNLRTRYLGNTVTM